MINLERLKDIGRYDSETIETKPEYTKNSLYKSPISIEVLYRGDLIYSSCNLGYKIKGEWYWHCGFCKKYTIQPILDYRCVRCQSKVIKVGDDKHIFYQKYLDRYLSLGKLEATANEDNQER